MESVFHICNCEENCQVKYATCTLLDSALTWWNSHVKTVGIDAAYVMTWKELIKMMIKVYCPRKEIQKLENELLQDTIQMANSLMDQKVCAIATRDADRKRKWEYEQEGNHRQQQNKRQEVGRVYVAGTCNKISYAGTLPPCDKCKFHHYGPCPIKCGNYKKVGHRARDCWTTTSVTCYRCGEEGHTKRYCPGMENQYGDEEALPNLDIVTCTSLLENRYIPVLTNVNANSSFVFTAISHLINVTSIFSVT
ncbi:putative reverse transcriptase domain-containing protein [Tanacetum coccineum]